MINNCKSSIELLPHQHFVLKDNLYSIDNELIFDLLDVAAYIYKYDVSTKITSSDKVRNIFITIPVTDVVLWNTQKSLIESIAKFLSSDNWNIKFIHSNSKKIKTYQSSFLSNIFENVTLLSGGLDSYCGAYYNIKHSINSIYCGYKINTYETHGLQNICTKLNELHKIPSKQFSTIKLKKVEHSQRTRSFLFFALACVCASMYNSKRILLYENGVLSLNPEFETRKTTKTTHPRTIFLVNKLLENLGFNLSIEHPFLFKTKGELIDDLSLQFKQNIKLTNTCGIARMNLGLENKKAHCGACIPCILRKISMTAYDNEQYDVEYDIPYGVKLSNCTSLLKKEFKSSNEYFMTFNERIKSKTILFAIKMKKEYYSIPNYIELTEIMLNNFSREIDKYYDRYPLY